MADSQPEEFSATKTAALTACPALNSRFMQMRAPMVSVVIPTYKGERYIMNAVHTVADQTYKNIETIVVIDGSQDGTSRLLECYKATLSSEEQERFHVIYQENRGVSAARNTGIRAAMGDFIALLDHDDGWHPEKIAAQMAEVLKHPEQNYIFCTSDHEIVNINSGERKIQKNGDSLSLTGLIKNSGAQPGTWLFSKAVTEKVGEFDEDLCIAEDGDYLVRVLDTDTIKCINVGQPLTAYNRGDDNSLSSGNLTARKIMSFARAFEKHHDLFKEKLPVVAYEQFMAWHRKMIPADILAAGLHRIKERNKSNEQTDIVSPAQNNRPSRSSALSG